jgi:hypothetical protein
MQLTSVLNLLSVYFSAFPPDGWNWLTTNVKKKKLKQTFFLFIFNWSRENNKPIFHFFLSFSSWYFIFNEVRKIFHQFPSPIRCRFCNNNFHFVCFFFQYSSFSSLISMIALVCACAKAQFLFYTFFFFAIWLTPKIEC